MANTHPNRGSSRVEGAERFGTPPGRGAIESRVRRVEERPPPPALVEAVEIEEMTRDSPDGRPPTWRTRWRGWGMLGVVLAVGVPMVIIAVLSVGGWAALVVAALFMILLGVAAGPVWVAGIMRREEEDEIDHEVVRDAGGETPV